MTCSSPSKAWLFSTVFAGFRRDRLMDIGCLANIRKDPIWSIYSPSTAPLAMPVLAESVLPTPSVVPLPDRST